jgi:hypothetical protein
LPAAADKILFKGFRKADETERGAKLSEMTICRLQFF